MHKASIVPEGQCTTYLESHHVTWLSRGGYDLIDNVVALCPNCHRKIHIRYEDTDWEHLLYRIASRNQL